MNSLIASLVFILTGSAAFASADPTFIDSRTFTPAKTISQTYTLINKSSIALNESGAPVVYTFVNDAIRGFVLQRKLSSKLSFDADKLTVNLNNGVNNVVCGHVEKSATGIANVIPTGACETFDVVSPEHDGNARLSTYIITK